jgi:hypothetical protein
MEMNTQNKDEDIINAELFGNDQKNWGYEDFAEPMTNVMISEGPAKKLEEIARKYDVKAIFSDNKISVPEPNTMEEAVNILGFWGKVFEEREGTPEKIEFLYQERNKELPLSYTKKMLRKVGFKIKTQEKEGDVKRESVKPESILSVDPLLNAGSFVKMITNKDEWKRLNKVAENSDTFSAPYVFALENLCYRVNIPLQCITKMELNK